MIDLSAVTDAELVARCKRHANWSGSHRFIVNPVAHEMAVRYEALLDEVAELRRSRQVVNIVNVAGTNAER